MNQITAKIIRLHKNDNCIVLGENIKQGDKILDGVNILVAEKDIALGHKIASFLISEGETVYKYGVSIGSATSLIQPGDHVHIHNMKSDYLPTFVLSADEEVKND